MPRSQSIFTELHIAKELTPLKTLQSIKGVTPNLLSQYAEELDARLNSIIPRKAQSVADLAYVGKAVYAYIIKTIPDDHVVAWRGGSKTNWKQTIPCDLMLEPSQLSISVKENSNVFINAAPLVVFQHLFDNTITTKFKNKNWYTTIAPLESQQYYEACQGPAFNQLSEIIDYYNASSKIKKEFSEHVRNLHALNSVPAIEAYGKLCEAVSERSAAAFNQKLAESLVDTPNVLNKLIQYFFRIGDTPYILCGLEANKPFAVLIPSLQEWLAQYELTHIQANPKIAGQPEVILQFLITNKISLHTSSFNMRIEIRWSHGKMCGNPESKIYKEWQYTELPWATNLMPLSNQ